MWHQCVVIIFPLQPSSSHPPIMPGPGLIAFSAVLGRRPQGSGDQTTSRVLMLTTRGVNRSSRSSTLFSLLKAWSVESACYFKTPLSTISLFHYKGVFVIKCSQIQIRSGDFPCCSARKITQPNLNPRTFYDQIHSDLSVPIVDSPLAGAFSE